MNFPQCRECRSNDRVHLFGDFARLYDPGATWFQCVRCDRTWVDVKLASELMREMATNTPLPPDRG